jgi:hypothetical protein
MSGWELNQAALWKHRVQSNDGEYLLCVYEDTLDNLWDWSVHFRPKSCLLWYSLHSASGVAEPCRSLEQAKTSALEHLGLYETTLEEA